MPSTRTSDSPPPAFTFEQIFTPEIIADPYPLYRQLRESTPALPLPDNNLLVLSSHALVREAVRNRHLGHADDPRLTEEQRADMLRNPAIVSLRNSMLVMNPPDHTRLRGLVVKAFDARRVETMRGRVVEIAERLVDGFIERGCGDLVDLFLHPLPVIVICDMLGIPERDQPGFVVGGRVRGRIIDPTPLTPEEMADANRGTIESQKYFSRLCDERRVEPQDDLITALVQSETEHGKLSKAELTANIQLLFAAGHETTVNLMGNALLALYRNPDQLALLRGDPGLMPGAVEEFLRYDSSVQLTGRAALQDTEIADIAIRKGLQVLALLGAANRDPEVFERPDELDITRQGIRPLSFGGGIHFCLGAQLARLEAAEALQVLFRRLPNLTLDNTDNPPWKRTITLRGLTALPATW